MELENVPLKKDVLDRLGLPVKVLVGYVGKVRFQIPVRKIRSEPWVISFEKVTLIAGPQDRCETRDEAAEEAAAQEAKLTALDALEAEWRSRKGERAGLPASSLYSLTYSSWIGYAASLITNIIQNLQVLRTMSLFCVLV